MSTVISRFPPAQMRRRFLPAAESRSATRVIRNEDELRQWAADGLAEALRRYRTVCGSQGLLDALATARIDEERILANETKAR